MSTSCTLWSAVIGTWYSFTSERDFASFIVDKRCSGYGFHNTSSIYGLDPEKLHYTPVNLLIMFHLLYYSCLNIIWYVPLSIKICWSHRSISLFSLALLRILNLWEANLIAVHRHKTNCGSLNLYFWSWRYFWSDGFDWKQLCIFLVGQSGRPHFTLHPSDEMCWLNNSSCSKKKKSQTFPELQEKNDACTYAVSFKLLGYSSDIDCIRLFSLISSHASFIIKQ